MTSIPPTQAVHLTLTVEQIERIIDRLDESSDGAYDEETITALVQALPAEHYAERERQATRWGTPLT